MKYLVVEGRNFRRTFVLSYDRTKVQTCKSPWKHSFQKKIRYEIQIISFQLRLTQKTIQAQKKIQNLFPKLLRLVNDSEKMSLVKFFEPKGLVYFKCNRFNSFVFN